MYYIDEVKLNVPKPIQDRSVNVLTFTEASTGAPFQLIVNRDVLIGDEDIKKCFDRQISLIARQTKDFKIISKNNLARDKMQPLVTLESKLNQSGKQIFQIQAMMITKHPQILVFTLSSATPLNAGHREFWHNLVDDLDPNLSQSI